MARAGSRDGVARGGRRASGGRSGTRPVRKSSGAAGQARVGARILHLDAFSGASGNMFMGALLDLGLSKKALLAGLAPLKLEFDLVVEKVRRSGFAARHVDVRVPTARGRRKRARDPRPPPHGHRDHAPPHAPPHAHPHADPHAHDDAGHAHGRRYAEIRDQLEGSAIPPTAKARALAIFEALGQAEARVHGVPLEDVHFHEVGAVDAIVDVTAAALGLELLGIERVSCTPVAIGHGTIRSDHGLLPLPAPATLELLKGIPTVPAAVEWETLTPTGAAILRTVVDEFGWLPAMTVEQVGYGAGNDRPGVLPNVLRGVLGRAGTAAFARDRIVCLEANLDDLVPEHFDHLMERLFEEGALDVSLQHLQMKKNRPGFLVRVLARPPDRDRLARLLFAESTAIGVRLAEWDRFVLERESIRIDTQLGRARVKVIHGPEGRTDYSPEYDDCKRIAREHGLPLREVVASVAAQARSHRGQDT